MSFPRLSRIVQATALASGCLVPQLSSAQVAKVPVRMPVLKPAAPGPLAAPFDTSALSAIRWREIGPYRGGRSVAVAGSAARPKEYWMGSVGGGVFKTTDGGDSWTPMSDRYFGGTIGAIGVAPSNPDIVYVGGGEFAIRGNVSHGDGMWKTTDGGRTWANIGLNDSRQISQVRVHPTNPDLVYVAAFGHVWGPNNERGIYRSKDGGKSWQKILFRDDSTGAADLVMDPTNPNVLYAGFWQAHRKPWMLVSGGKGSGMFLSRFVQEVNPNYSEPVLATLNALEDLQYQSQGADPACRIEADNRLVPFIGALPGVGPVHLPHGQLTHEDCSLDEPVNISACPSFSSLLDQLRVAARITRPISRMLDEQERLAVAFDGLFPDHESGQLTDFVSTLRVCPKAS